MGSSLQSALRSSAIPVRRDIQAVILAAGRGSRLGDIIDQRPKCLAPIDGQALIEHQIDLLRGAGIERIAVVTGYRAEEVKIVVGERAVYFHNSFWATTEGMYSLVLCRNWVNSHLLVINCDVLLDPEGLERLLQGPPNSFAFDSSSGGDAEQMAVEFEGDCLSHMSKNLPLARTHGENVGLLYFERRAALLLFHEAASLLKLGASKARLPTAVQRVAQYIPFHGVDIAGLPWVEIDFPADLQVAVQMIWPAIIARHESYVTADMEQCA